MSSGSYSPVRTLRNNAVRKSMAAQGRVLGENDDDKDSPSSGEFFIGDDDYDDDDEEEGEYEEDEEEDEGVFKSRLKMPPYEHAKRKLSQLTDLMNGPYLDLAPHYQRDVVWTSRAMAHLIDSLWKGYYIPPIIFNLELIEDEEKRMRFKRTCVDGKQRLNSIKKFMNGDFPCWINKKAWYFQKPRGRIREVNELPESARDEFKSIEILCTEYKGLSERQEIELFQRVQLGKPLSRAEALRATEGGWQEHAKSYESKFANVTNLCKNHRASGFRTTLTCFIQIYEGFNPKVAADGVPVLWNTFKLLETFCSTAPPLDSKSKAHFRFVFEMIGSFAEKDRAMFYSENYTKSQSLSPLSPIELVAVAALISQKGTERPPNILKDDVVALIACMREAHVDLRMSKVCWTTAWNFISKLEQQRGAIGEPSLAGPVSKLIKKPRGPRAPRRISSAVVAAPNLANEGDSDDLTLPTHFLSNAIFGTLPGRRLEESNTASRPRPSSGLVKGGARMSSSSNNDNNKTSFTSLARMRKRSSGGFGGRNGSGSILPQQRQEQQHEQEGEQEQEEQHLNLKRRRYQT